MSRSGYVSFTHLPRAAYLLALLSGICSGALAQTYPNKPVRLIIPFPAGAAADIVGRTFATKFSEIWGQQVVADNRGGANTIVGAEIAAKAAPDGYTLFLASAATQVTNPLLYRQLPYDRRKGFQPISLTTEVPFALVTHPSLPVNSVRELVAYARARPGELAYASSGTGSVGHLAGVMFETMTGTKMLHVPYKGGGPATIDLVGGQIRLYFATMPTISVHLQNHKVKVLGIATAKRNPNWPEIPTVAESGYPGYEMNSWYGLAAPAATPRAITEHVHAAVLRASTSSDVVERMRTLGASLSITTPEEFTAYIARDYERVAKAVKAAGITLEQ